jgi:hypothetical protein
VARERPRGGAQPLLGLDVPDRAEHADDRVEALAEVEFGHVRLVKRNVRKALSRDREHLRVRVEPLDFVAPGEVLEVRARATGDVEQRSCAWASCLDQPVELRRLAGVVANRRVDRVVKVSGATEHRATS